MKTLISTLLCLLPPAVAAQTATRVAGPVTGIIFDRASGSLRPMVGVPGASYLGDALISGLETASVSPDGEMALAVSEGRLLLISGLKSAPVPAVIDALAGDQFVWSTGGSSAAVYSSRAGQAQVIRDVRAGAAPGALIDVPGAVASLALGDAGDLVAGLDSGVCLLAPGSAARVLAPLARAGALAIRGSDLFAAADGQIWLIGNFATSPSAAVFAGDAGEIVGLQVSGKRLIAADAGNLLIKAFDLATRAVVGQAGLDSKPSELRAFGGQDVWLLNSGACGPEPLWVATGAGDPAAWFVPAGRVQ